MPRRKIEIGLIGNARDRKKTFRQRKKGLAKKAKELADLCDVDIAVICAGPGGGAPDVWMSSPGVIDRYRALPAVKRAEHTHLNYVNDELRKERNKLAKVREDGPKALALPKKAVLKDMGLEELLGSIDAALLATAERRKALGAPGADVADDGQPGQVEPGAIVPLGQEGAPFVGDEDMEAWINELMWDDVVEQQPLDAIMMQQPASGLVQYINGDVVDMGSNQCQAQMLPDNGENDHGQPAWDAYQLQNTIPYPDDGFKCADDNNYLAMDGCSRMPVPSNGNAYGYEHDVWLRTAMFGADETSCNAVVPVGHPSLGISGDSVYTASGHFTMDISNNFTAAPAVGLDDSYMYETHCLADYFENPYSNQNFGVEPLRNTV